MRRILASLIAIVTCATAAAAQPRSTAPAPVPLISAGHPAQWVFAYKLNASSFPTDPHDSSRLCPFGGTPRPGSLGARYAYASDSHSRLQAGPGLIGTSLNDPVGATFNQIYNGNYFYVVWNDQFQNFPMPELASPWGHSKGILAWNAAGDGLVMQVTTPAWPGAGSARHPRQGEGNTLGCLTRARNNMTNAQHFFALRLNPHDVELVLTALQNASVVTNVHDTTQQIASIGGPATIQALAMRLGVRSQSTSPTDAMLSSGVRLISKPSLMHVPPWQLVSAMLGRPTDANGPELRTATWWASPRIPSTASAGDPNCWGFPRHPGPVAIALNGSWSGQAISLIGGANHAKIGVSVTDNDAAPWYTIFGDLNQQGALADNPATHPDECASSQNGRGGLFFVVENRELHDSVRDLIEGQTAPDAPAARRRIR